MSCPLSICPAHITNLTTDWIKLVLILSMTNYQVNGMELNRHFVPFQKIPYGDLLEINMILRPFLFSYGVPA